MKQVREKVQDSTVQRYKIFMKNLDTTHYDKLEVLLEEVESEKEFRSISNGKNYYVYGNFIAIYGICTGNTHAIQP